MTQNRLAGGTNKQRDWLSRLACFTKHRPGHWVMAGKKHGNYLIFKEHPIVAQILIALLGSLANGVQFSGHFLQT